MALDVSTIKNYVDANQKQLIGSAILKGKTVSMITPQVGVKKSAYLNLLNNTATLQAGGCGWSAAGTTNITQRILETGLVKVNEAFCEKDLLGTVLQHDVQLAVGQKKLPFEQDFIEGKLASIQAKLEETVWKGDIAAVTDSHLKRFDGFRKIIKAATGVVDATGTASDPLKKQFVIGIIDNVFSAMPIEVVTSQDAVIFCGSDVFRTYVLALRDANLYHYDAKATDMELVVPGTNVKLVAVNGLNGTREIYAGQLSNFVFGTDMTNDSEKFDFWYSQDNREFRLAVEFNAGVQVAFTNELTKYIGVSI